MWCLPFRGTETRIRGGNLPLSCRYRAHLASGSSEKPTAAVSLPLERRLAGKRRRDCLYFET